MKARLPRWIVLVGLVISWLPSLICAPLKYKWIPTWLMVPLMGNFIWPIRVANAGIIVLLAICAFLALRRNSLAAAVSFLVLILIPTSFCVLMILLTGL